MANPTHTPASTTDPAQTPDDKIRQNPNADRARPGDAPKPAVTTPGEQERLEKAGYPEPGSGVQGPTNDRPAGR